MFFPERIRYVSLFSVEAYLRHLSENILLSSAGSVYLRRYSIRMKFIFSHFPSLLRYSIQFSQKLFDDVDLWLLELKIKSISLVRVEMK